MGIEFKRGTRTLKPIRGNQKLWRGLLILVLGAGLGLGVSSLGWTEKIEVEYGGFLELRGTYDTNLFLTAEDYDFELRRLSGDKTEEDDVYGTLSGDFYLNIPFNEVYEQRIGFEFEGEAYDDYSDENNTHQRFQLQPTFHLSGNADLILEYELEVDNRRDKAEYLRPDYLDHQIGVALDWKLYSEGNLTLKYFYENRDYESLTGTPFDDYDGHTGQLRWKHSFNKKFYTTSDFRYRYRDYDEDTLDEFGNTILGKDREDERAEIGLALTFLPHPKVLLRTGYLYRNTWAPGDFYDYELHRLYGIWVQKFPWQLQWQTYLHYEWRDYDHQQAQDTLFNPILGGYFQSPPTGVRDDEQLFLLLSLTKELGKGFSCGTEFQYMNNDSNDDSTEFEAEKYSFFVRYKF